MNVAAGTGRHGASHGTAPRADPGVHVRHNFFAAADHTETAKDRQRMVKGGERMEPSTKPRRSEFLTSVCYHGRRWS